MLEIYANDRLSPGVRVALQDLPLELARMGKGDVYWINATKASDLRALCQEMLVSADGTARVALVGDHDYSDLLDTIHPQQGPADVRIYQLKGNVQRGLVRLTKDLDRGLNPRNRLLIVALDETSLPLRDSVIARLLKVWKTWLSRNDCTMLVMCHGATIASRVPSLLPMNDSLAGLALLETEENSISYHVFHWRTVLGVVGSVRLPLARVETRLHVLEHAPETSSWSSDRNRFLLDREALEGTPVFMANDWHVCNGWADLYSRGLTATAATIVFAFSDHSELVHLARMLYALRKQRGPALKLVVRAMQRPLRYYDEKMLLDCGATMIVPESTHLSGFLGLLEAVQSQTFTRPLAKNIGLLIERRQLLTVSGEMPISKFTGFLEQIHEQAEHMTAAGVLVELVPVPGLSAQQAMTQLKIRRLGDIACHMQGVVYLFLSGCRPALVDVALGNVFRLPFREMFSEHRLYYSLPDIAKKNKALEYLASKSSERTARPDAGAFDATQPSPESHEVLARAEIDLVPEHLHGLSILRPQLEPLLLD